MKTLLFVCLLQYSIASLAQNNAIKPLSIGDTVPDIKFENVLNYKSSKASLSDFRGKLVLLDIWSVGCGTCIEAFPKVESLQEKFNGKIQILLVNPNDPKYETPERVNAILNRQKERTGFYTKLPIPIQDSILRKYFPYQSVPHYVWIDKDGVILAITGYGEVKAENVTAFLQGRKLDLPFKDGWVYDTDKPFLVDNNGGNPNNFLYRSVFTGFQRKASGNIGVRKDKNGDVIGLYMLNVSLRYFLEDTYGVLFDGFVENRKIFQTRPSLNLGYEIDTANQYCYDLTIPPTPLKSFDRKKYIKEDLKRYFNLSVRKETRRTKVWIVSEKDTLSKLIKKNSKQSSDLENSTARKHIHGYSVAEAIGALDLFSLPLIYEGRFSGEIIDIDFPVNFNLSDEKKVLEELKKMGFTVKEEEREIEVVVVTDKDA